MPELLLELFSEEIPARMQPRAAEDLKRLVTEALAAQGLACGAAYAFATPRRLALVVENVPAKSPDLSEERKGPRVNAPEQAIAGFVKSAGLKSIKDAQVVKDEKKGDFYAVRIDKPGVAIEMILIVALPQILMKFPWPKSMRWGVGSLSWVRPLRSIVLCLDGKPLELNLESGVNRIGLIPKGSAHNPDFPTRVPVGNITRGHRFYGNEPFQVEGAADYVEALKQHKVILAAPERAELIASQARALAKEHKLALVEDEALLAENAGLTEWPQVLMGSFDEAFLAVPAECLMLSMKQHQKCFSLKHPRTGKLANKFLLVSNLIAEDGGREIIAGNEKVIAARLSDAKFFWEQDLKKPLDEMAVALGGITFHEKLGSQKERVERVAELAFQIAGSVDAVPEDARRAAQLAKADLVSGMVGEFPELQGLMGRTYAEAAGAKPEIARAIELHYKPKGPNDTVPRVEDGDAVAAAVALADKLDTLVGFWAIEEKPTGSGDPYQLRRAALGVIRIVLENDLRLPLRPVVAEHIQRKAEIEANEARDRITKDILEGHEQASDLLAELQASKTGDEYLHLTTLLNRTSQTERIPAISEQDARRIADAYVDRFATVEFKAAWGVADDLLSFFADRLKVHLREKGARHDLIDAVFSLGGQDDLALIVRRVEALGEFLKTDDGANLLIGVKRATNILRDEEKKDKRSYAGAADPALLREPQEKTLYAAIQKVKKDTAAALNVENFAGAMRALAELRAPVDAFFDKVTVNVTGVPDADKLRANRLALLSEIRAATLNVADFSKIAG